MKRIGLLTLVATLLWGQNAWSQAGAFRWQTGQVLTYRAQQSTSALEVNGPTKTETATRLMHLKRWQVLNVDAQGTATIQLSLLALRFEYTTPRGEVLTYDSANPDKSDPQMKEQMSQYVGKPLAQLRIDASGRVLEVKDSKFGPPSRYENELPFALVTAGAAVQAGQSWQRAYKITLDPPQGTGEKYDAVQNYTCKTNDGRLATIALSTEVKTLPEGLVEQIPLLQLQPAGEVVFDVTLGCVRKVQLQIEKELVGHQGEGSRYQFKSLYNEELLDAP